MKEDSIATIKAMIEQESGIPTNEQRLFLQDTEGFDSIMLDDDKTLMDYGLMRTWQSKPGVQELIDLQVPFFVLPDRRKRKQCAKQRQATTHCIDRC